MLWIFLFQTSAFADVLKFKEGGSKTGRILAESEGQVLFQDADGAVTEFPASSISILDRADTSQKTGQVSFYTNSPRKKKKTVPKFNLLPAVHSDKNEDKPEVQLPSGGLEEASLQKLDNMLQGWLEKHPEAKKWLETAAG